MPHGRLRRTATATAVALASGLVSAQAAGAAGTDSTGPVITIGSTSIDEHGPAGDLDISVTAPPASDAYIRLALDAGSLDQLTITDDAGTVLPITEVPGQPGSVTLGAADSDHNGIPGASLTAGTLHLHVSVGYPAPSLVLVTGYLIDGTSGTIVARTGVGAGGEINVGEPRLSAQWDIPGQSGPVYSGTVGIPSGGPVATTAVQTQMSMHTPPAATHTRWTIPADQITSAGYTPAQLATALHIGYSPATGSYTTKHWTTTADGSLVIDLPTHQWVQPNSSVTESLHVAVDWGLPAGTVTGVFETLADDGTPYAQSHQTLRFTTDIVPAAHRASLYGRDSAGVLWQHQATALASHPGTFYPRTRVGGGWNIYNALTALGPLKANGTGDVVARDTAGVLWYYQGTGNGKAPFATRIRIGGGWGVYNQIIGAGDITGDGHPDLVARDATGVLWLYRGTGRTDVPLANRTRICGGWQIYNQLLTAGDITGDGHPDLLARDTAGVLWYYPGTGNAAAPYANRVRIGGGWNIYTSIVGIGDMTGEGHQDLVARDTTGKLWYYRGTGNPAAPFATRTPHGGGLNIYDTLL